MFEIILPLVIVIIIAGPIIIFLKNLGTPNRNNEKRTRMIEEKVISIGGKVMNIET